MPCVSITYQISSFPSCILSHFLLLYFVSSVTAVQPTKICFSTPSALQQLYDRVMFVPPSRQPCQQLYDRVKFVPPSHQPCQQLQDRVMFGITRAQLRATLQWRRQFHMWCIARGTITEFVTFECISPKRMYLCMSQTAFLTNNPGRDYIDS